MIKKTSEWHSSRIIWLGWEPMFLCQMLLPHLAVLAFGRWRLKWRFCRSRKNILQRKIWKRSLKSIQALLKWRNAIVTDDCIYWRKHLTTVAKITMDNLCDAAINCIIMMQIQQWNLHQSIRGIALNISTSRTYSARRAAASRAIHTWTAESSSRD